MLYYIRHDHASLVHEARSMVGASEIARAGATTANISKGDRSGCTTAAREPSSTSPDRLDPVSCEHEHDTLEILTE